MVGLGAGMKKPETAEDEIERLREALEAIAERFNDLAILTAKQNKNSGFLLASALRCKHVLSGGKFHDRNI